MNFKMLKLKLNWTVTAEPQLLLKEWLNQIRHFLTFLGQFHQNPISLNAKCIITRTESSIRCLCLLSHREVTGEKLGERSMFVAKVGWPSFSVVRKEQIAPNMFDWDVYLFIFQLPPNEGNVDLNQVEYNPLKSLPSLDKQLTTGASLWSENLVVKKIDSRHLITVEWNTELSTTWGGRQWWQCFC